MNMIIKKTNLNLVSIVLKEEIQMRAYEKPVITVEWQKGFMQQVEQHRAH